MPPIWQTPLMRRHGARLDKQNKMARRKACERLYKQAREGTYS